MPSQFDQAFELSAAPQLDDWFGVSVTLKQGGLTTEAFTATWQAKDHAVRGRDGSLLTTVRTRDYVLQASDLVLQGKTVDPRPGAVLTEVASGERFQIVAIGEMPAVDKYGGNYRWLVHTNRIASG